MSERFLVFYGFKFTQNCSISLIYETKLILYSPPPPPPRFLLHSIYKIKAFSCSVGKSMMAADMSKKKSDFSDVWYYAVPILYASKIPSRLLYFAQLTRLTQFLFTFSAKTSHSIYQIQGEISYFLEKNPRWSLKSQPFWSGTQPILIGQEVFM